MSRTRFARARCLTSAGGLATAASLAALAACSNAGASVGAPGPEDMTMGNPQAKVLVAEYASVACPHCAAFNNDIMPAFKAKYIDTGKVRFIFREFPLDPLAAGASMLARCADKDKFYPLIETLFQLQSKWAVEKPIPQLMAIAKQAGMSEQTLTPACRIRRCSTPCRKSRSGPPTNSASIPRRPCSSTARSTSAACRSRTWPRPSTRFFPSPDLPKT